MFGVCDDENDAKGVDDGQDHDPKDGVPGVPVFLELRFFHSSVSITGLDKLKLVKFCYGGLALCFSWFPLRPQLPQKMPQNWSKWTRK